MQSLQTMLLNIYLYANHLKYAYKVLKQYPDTADANICLCVMPEQDEWHYNIPSLDEVTVILPGDSTASQRWDIIFCFCTDDHFFIQIDDGHPAYTPLYYILLFPNGDHGWHHDLLHWPVPGSVPKPGWKALCISQTQHFSFCLYMHDGEYLTIHWGGHLFQQYIVDMWASVDQTWLAFLRFNQGQLCTTLYSGFKDWLTTDEVGNP